MQTESKGSFISLPSFNSIMNTVKIISQSMTISSLCLLTCK